MYIYKLFERKLKSNLKGILTSWSNVSDLPHGIRRKGNTVCHQGVLEDGLHSKVMFDYQKKKNIFFGANKGNST